MPHKYTIYVVLDPATGNPVYVGQTGDLASRRAGHLLDARRTKIGKRQTAFHRWLADRISEGYALELLPVYATEVRDEALKLERALIDAFELCGFRLLNAQKYVGGMVDLVNMPRRTRYDNQWRFRESE